MLCQTVLDLLFDDAKWVIGYVDELFIGELYDGLG